VKPPSGGFLLFIFIERVTLPFLEEDGTPAISSR
jgi:hypothetical protein